MRNLSKTGKKINSLMGKAIHDHSLIKDGDNILIAVSGGKDSLTLLTLLKEIQRWAPVKFGLTGVHVSTDFKCGGCMHDKTLTDIFDAAGIECHFLDIKVLDEKGQTTCFWCSWNRRKALFELAEKLGCNKLALGHHKDDIVETMLLNLIYQGEISAMNPRQELFNGKITIIRPLCYVDEDTIKTFAAESDFPPQLCTCPFGRQSRRKYIKRFLREAGENTPEVNIKTNIFKAVGRIRSEYLDVGTENEDGSGPPVS